MTRIMKIWSRKLRNSIEIRDFSIEIGVLMGFVVCSLGFVKLEFGVCFFGI